MSSHTVLFCFGFIILLLSQCEAGLYKKGRLEQLYEDLLFWYIPMVRPSENPSDILNVNFGAYLIQLIEVDEKNQVFRASLWLEMEWYDKRLRWQPEKYGNVTTIHMPTAYIWTPDIVVYNNADGKPQITIYTDVLVAFTGKVIWKPPLIVKSFCEVDIAFFPYDEQKCRIKFGTWSYDGQYVDLSILEHLGMDVSYYTRSNEWDIMNITVVRHEVVYPGCCGQKIYVDITYELFLRRRPLFYTANMIFPCAMISLVTVFVFCTPSDSRQRMTLSIGLFVSLSVFFLLLQEIMPATSLSVPLMSKYILFNMTSIGVAILITVITLNIHHRDANSSPIGQKAKHFFFAKLAPWLGIKFPKRLLMRQESDWQEYVEQLKESASTSTALNTYNREQSTLIKRVNRKTQTPYSADMDLSKKRIIDNQLIQRALNNVRFIATYHRMTERQEKVSLEWSCLSLVLDRLCLYVFALFTLITSCILILQVPYVYDSRPSLTTPDPEYPLGYTHWNP